MDLENSNPGLVTVGRPNILGSIHAMKSSGHTTCSVRFTVEKSAASDAALRSSCICLHGGNWVVRLWTEHTPAKVCNNCLQLGYFATRCAFLPRCRLCRGNHATQAHLCQARNCDSSVGEACLHTIRLCLLCEPSGHYTGFAWCPALQLTPESNPPALGGSPISGDPSTVTGVANRSHERENQKRNHCRRPTPTGEVVLNTTIEAKDFTAAWDVKGRGKAVVDYESASPPAPANYRVSASSDKGFGKSPMPSDNDCVFATARSVLGAATPVPKSILRRPTSAPIESSPAGASG